MATVSNEVKMFIVQALACHDSPSQVAEGVLQEFKVTVTRQFCEQHNPTKAAGKNLSKRWRDVFFETRTKFLEDVSDIPIANKAVRLRELDRIRMTSGKNNQMKMQALEQAAKEMGEAFTNKRDVSGNMTVGVLSDLMDELTKEN